jgi:glutamate-5-semialdehyde dehydrogenase
MGEQSATEGGTVRDFALAAKAASRRLSHLSTAIKNRALREMAVALRAHAAEIEAANAADIAAARANGAAAVTISRLALSDAHGTGIEAMAATLEGVAALPDPIGNLDESTRMPEGIEVARMRVPLGVVAMIYESRPSVLVDSVALGIKTGNAMLLRGGREALSSNLCIERILLEVAKRTGVPDGAFRVFPRPDHEDVSALLRMSDLIALVIPRGGRALVKLVEEHATMPVLRHGPGVCHVYVDASADVEIASRVVIDGKVGDPYVCNATEAVLVHRDIAERFWAACAPRLHEGNVEVRGDDQVLRHVPWAKRADDTDWGKEYLGLVLAARTVASLDEAIEYLARYGTNHTETIVTRDLQHARRFVNEVDAGAVIVNGSTRLNDGWMFGLGAQIGISTSKFHAYGPMGLRELTTTKFVVSADGHTRP